MSDLISRQAAIDAIHNLYAIHGSEGSWIDQKDAFKALNSLPSAQPEWNNHKVACLLAELFNDVCACNYNGIDEWLPEKCELLDSCPNPGGVACWEQFLKHKTESEVEK